MAVQLKVELRQIAGASMIQALFAGIVVPGYVTEKVEQREALAMLQYPSAMIDPGRSGDNGPILQSSSKSRYATRRSDPENISRWYSAVYCLLRPREFLLDTEHTTLTADGYVNFKDETLDVRLAATPKGGSVVALRGPVVMRGTFATFPAPDLARLAARGGAITALGLFASPFAAIIPLIAPGGRKDLECARFVEAAQRFIQ